MSRRKQPYQKKPFESTGVSSDTSANVYMSMLLSDAWKDLTAHELPHIVRTAQKGLNVGKYEVLSGVAQRERRHSSF